MNINANPHRLLSVALLLTGLFVEHRACAAQSYDNCAGFIDSVPATISTQGVWCLRHDLATNITGGIAIVIATNNVTIDCNDFKLGGLAAGTSSSATGVGAGNRQNVTVRHCNIRGFYQGIGLSGAGNLVEDNRLDNNLYVGIYVDGDNNRVRRNAVYDTGGFVVSNTAALGIQAQADIVDNTVVNVSSNGATHGTGIYMSYTGHQVSGNVVAGIGSTYEGTVGIAVNAENVTVAGNSISNGASPSLTNDTGISGNGSTFCKDNTIGYFDIPMANCQDAGGNASH